MTTRAYTRFHRWADAFVARYQGSFFGLRAAVDRLDQDTPAALIVYLPGIVTGRARCSWELEKGGTCYEPQLKRLALNVLRKRFTDGQIDDMLRPVHVTYDDIVSFLQQGEDGKSASVLRSLFEGAHSEALLTRWLASDGKRTIEGRHGASSSSSSRRVWDWHFPKPRR